MIRPCPVRVVGSGPLLGTAPGRRETAAEYEAAGGYGPGARDERLLRWIDEARLRGRGGAGFPAAVKWRSVREREGPRFVVANAEEGEPLSFKDRYLMRYRPHLVIDGLQRCAGAVGASRAWIYVSDPLAAESAREALRERRATLPIEVAVVPPGYVAGEETAVVRALSGGPALPTSKPPRPFEAGVDGRPTLVQNVETLANVPAIALAGPEAFLRRGTASTTGTLLITLSGAGVAPTLCEAEAGTRLGALIGEIAPEASPAGVFVGGFFGGLLGPRALDLPLCYETVALGCGAIGLLDEDECPVGAAADVMTYFTQENARQCGSCINGTAAMRDALVRMTSGTASEDDRARLLRLSTMLPGRGACGTLDAAARLAGSLLEHFAAAVEDHLAAACGTCATGAGPGHGLRYAVVAEERHEDSRSGMR